MKQAGKDLRKGLIDENVKRRHRPKYSSSYTREPTDEGPRDGAQTTVENRLLPPAETGSRLKGEHDHQALIFAILLCWQFKPLLLKPYKRR